MPGLRPFALMQTDDQWVRCAHWQTRLHGGDEGIELGFQPVQPDDAPTAAPTLAAGFQIVQTEIHGATAIVFGAVLRISHELDFTFMSGS